MSIVRVFIRVSLGAAVVASCADAESPADPRPSDSSAGTPSLLTDGSTSPDHDAQATFQDAATQSDAPDVAEVPLEAGPDPDVATANVPTGSVTCPSGTAVSALVDPLCAALNNSVSYPGPCSMHTRHLAPLGAPPWLETCDYTYTGTLLSSKACVFTPCVEVTDANPCSSGEDTPTWHTTSLEYGDAGHVTVIRRSLLTDILDRCQVVLPTGNRENICDECDSCQCDCASGATTIAANRATWLAAMFGAFPPPPGAHETWTDSPYIQCSLEGSVAEGEVRYICAGGSIDKFTFDEVGRLILLQVGSATGPDPSQLTDVYGANRYLYLYDEGENLRYVLETRDDYVSQSQSTVLREFFYACWQ